MNFPYVEDWGEGDVRHLPLVPLVIHGPAASVELLALVDSGAEQSVFSAEYAQRAGLSFADSTPVCMFGVGDQEIPGVLLPVDLQLGPHRWTGPAVFSAQLRAKAILGQVGFFSFFTVTFRRARLQMEVRRARSRV
jgi:hypothetical protein